MCHSAQSFSGNEQTYGRTSVPSKLQKFCNMLFVFMENVLKPINAQESDTGLVYSSECIGGWSTPSEGKNYTIVFKHIHPMQRS